MSPPVQPEIEEAPPLSASAQRAMALLLGPPRPVPVPDMASMVAQRPDVTAVSRDRTPGELEPPTPVMAAAGRPDIATRIGEETAARFGKIRALRERMSQTPLGSAASGALESVVKSPLNIATPMFPGMAETAETLRREEEANRSAPPLPNAGSRWLGEQAGGLYASLPVFEGAEAAAAPFAEGLTESLMARGAPGAMARAVGGGARGALVAGGGSAAMAAAENPNDPLTAAAVGGVEGAKLFGPLGAAIGTLAPAHVQLEGALQARQFEINEAAKAAAAAAPPPETVPAAGPAAPPDFGRKVVPEAATPQQTTVAAEGMPSRDVQRVPGIHDAPLATRLGYGTERLDAIHDHVLSDLLPRLGLPEDASRIQEGTWDRKANSNVQVQLPSGVDDNVKRVIASVLGSVGEQDATAWMTHEPNRAEAIKELSLLRPGPELDRRRAELGVAGQHGAAVVALDQPLTPSEVQELAEKLPANLTFTHTGRELIFGNFTGDETGPDGKPLPGLSDADLASRIHRELGEHPSIDEKAGDIKLGRFDGELIGGKHGPSGEQWQKPYAEAAQALRGRGIATLPPDLLQTYHDRLADPYRQIDERYASALPERTSGAAPGGGASAAERTPGSPAGGEQPLVLEHHSNQPGLRIVSPEKFGVGPVEGGERARAQTGKGAFLPRSYFYEEGTPPEAGLGPHVYRTEVSRGKIYDLGTDPERILSQAKGDLTQAERLIRDSGYAGYRNSAGPSPKTVALFNSVHVRSVGERATGVRSEAGYVRPWKVKPADPAEGPLDLQEASSRLIRGKSLAGLDADRRGKVAGRYLLSEAQEALKRLPAGTSDWYRGPVAKLEVGLREQFPALHDPDNMRLFKMVLAITSNGVPPDTNLEAATDVWKSYERTGKLVYRPSQMVGSTRQQSWVAGIRKLRELVDSHGGDVGRAMDALGTPGIYKPRLAYPEYLSSHMFGDKVGRFWLNLNGVYHEPTIDSWMIRQWRRVTGQPIPVPRDQATGAPGQFLSSKPELREIRAAYQGLADELTKSTGQKYEAADAQALMWYWEKEVYDRVGHPAEKGITYEQALHQLRGTTPEAAADAPVELGDAWEAPESPATESGHGPSAPEGADEAGAAGRRTVSTLAGAGVGAVAGAATAPPGKRTEGAIAGAVAGGAAGAGLGSERVKGEGGFAKIPAKLSPEEMEKASKYLNLSKVPEDVRDHLGAAVNRLVDAGEISKHPVTWAQQKEAATKLLMDPDDLSPDKVKRLNAPETLALGNMVVDNERQLIDLQRRINDPAATPEEMEAHQKAIDKLEAMNDKATAQVADTRSEKGRLLNSLKQELDGLLDPKIPLEEKMAAWRIKAAEMVGDRPLSAEERGKLRELVSVWHTSADDPAAAKAAQRALVDYTASLKALTIPQAISKMLVANIISSPAVFPKAVGGAMTWHALMSVPARAVAAGIDWLFLSPWTGERSVSRPTLPQMAAAAKGAQTGALNAVRALTGQAIKDPRGPEWAQVELERKVDPTGRGLIGRGTASVLNTYNHWISRTVTGTHATYFNAITRGAQEGALREMADLQAARELPKGSSAERNALALEFYKDPSRMPGAEAYALEAGLEASLRNRGVLVRLIQSARHSLDREGGVASLAGTAMVPVANVPANALEAFFKWTPGIGQARLPWQFRDLTRAVTQADPALIRSAQRTVAMNAARGVIGASGFLGLGAWMASKGLATGRLPDDPKEAREWAQEGKTPWSVRVGDRWHNVSVFVPAGMMFAFGADLHRAWTQALDAKGNRMTLPQRFAESLMTPVKMTLDLPFLQQPKRIMEAATTGRGGAAIGAGTAAMAVPLSSLQRRLARYTDPISRAPEGFVQEWETGIPGLSKRVPPAISPTTGEPITHPTGLFTNLIDPTSPRDVQDELVQREAARFGVVIDKPVRQASETQAQYVERQQRTGRAIHEHLRMLFNSPGWQREAARVDTGDPKSEAPAYLNLQKVIKAQIGYATAPIIADLRQRGEYVSRHQASVERAERLLGVRAEAPPSTTPPEPNPTPVPPPSAPPAPKPTATKVRVTKRDGRGRPLEYELAGAGD